MTQAETGPLPLDTGDRPITASRLPRERDEFGTDTSAPPDRRDPFSLRTSGPRT